MYEFKNSLRFWIFKIILILDNINRCEVQVLKPFQYVYPNKEYLLMLLQEVIFHLD